MDYDKREELVEKLKKININDLRDFLEVDKQIPKYDLWEIAKAHIPQEVKLEIYADAIMEYGIDIDEIEKGAFRSKISR